MTVLPTRIVSLNGPYEVYIGRAGHGHSGYFGNPVVPGKPCPICDEVHVKGGTLECYAIYLDRRIDSDPDFAERVKELSGRTLGCFCAPSRVCHGYTLASRADALAGVEPAPGTLDRLFAPAEDAGVEPVGGAPGTVAFDWNAAVKSTTARAVREVTKLRCRKCGKELTEASVGLPQVMLDALGVLAFATNTGPTCGACGPIGVEIHNPPTAPEEPTP